MKKNLKNDNPEVDGHIENLIEKSRARGAALKKLLKEISKKNTKNTKE